MHNVLPNSRAFPHHLGRHCRKLGVDIRLASPVVDLVTASGRVTGVTVQDARGRRIEITARNGVVLASGDYSGSAKMKRELASEMAARTDPVNPVNTGDGQRLGQAEGGRIINGDIVWAPRLPPAKVACPIDCRRGPSLDRPRGLP